MALKIINPSDYKGGRTIIQEPFLRVNIKGSLSINPLLSDSIQDLKTEKKVVFLFDDETNTYYITSGYSYSTKAFAVTENKGSYNLSNKSFAFELIKNLNLPLGKKIGDTDEILQSMRLSVSTTPETIGGFKNLHKVLWEK